MELKSFKIILKNAMERQPVPFIRRVRYVWYTALGFFAVGSIAIIIFSIYIFSRIQNDLAFQTHTTTAEVKSIIKQTRLESILVEFDKKAENFKNINLVKPNIVDPSL